MAVETKIEEIKEVVLKRVPPGDRWSPVGSPSTTLESLTDALEYHFQNNGETQFFWMLEKGQLRLLERKKLRLKNQ